MNRLVTVLLVLLLPVAASGEDQWEAFLTQRAAVDIARDGDFIYIATKGGVLRWDTVQEGYTVYLPADGLASVDLAAVAVDGSGNKWFAHTNPDLGVSLLDSAGNWSLISSFEGLQLDPGKAATTAVSRGDSVWIGTQSGATLFVRGERTRIVSEEKEGIVSDNIYSIVSSGEDAWFGTDQGLSRFSRGTVRNYTVDDDSLPAGEILCMAIDDEGNVWCGTPRGVFQVVDGEVVFPARYALFNNTRVRSIAFEEEGGEQIPWFATNNGPYRGTDAKLNRAATGDTIPQRNLVMDVYVDEEGDIWMAHENRWIYEWVPFQDGWRQHPLSGGLDINFVSDVAVDFSDDVWLTFVGNLEGPATSPGRNVRVRKGSGWFAVPFPDTLNDVCAVAIDSLGNRWFGVRRAGRSPGNLVKVDAGLVTIPTVANFQFFDISAASGFATGQAVFNVSVGPDNTKWVAVTKVGVAALDSAENELAWGSFTAPGCLRDEDEFDGPSTIDVVGAPGGVAWISFEQNYATKVDYGETLSIPADDDCAHFSLSNSPLPSNEIYTVRVDSRGRVWFGANGGLGVFDSADSSWAIYTQASTEGGLPNNKVRAIAFDAAGNAFIGTLGGGLGLLLADGTWEEPWTVEENSRRGSGLTNNSIMNIEVHQSLQGEEEVWIATWGGGVNRLVVDWDSRNRAPDEDEEVRVYAYPNPFRAGEGGVDRIAFRNSPVGSQIEIFTLTGELVRTIQGPESAEADDPSWDVKNSEAVDVGSGVFFFLVRVEGEVYFSGKLAILR